MLDKFVNAFTSGRPRFVRRRDDNWVDRLNSRATVALLLGFTVLLGLAQWVRKPMNCWLPKNFDIIHREYIHIFCWVMPYYYLPYTEEIPKVHEDDKRGVVLYYQWIPWILLTQAFLFWFPSGIWHWLSEKSGLSTENILSMAQVLNDTKKLDKKEERVTLLASYIDYFLVQKSSHIDNVQGCTSGCGRGCQCCCRGSKLALSYLFIKVLYIANLVFQIFALGSLLTTDYHKHLVNYVNYHQGTNTTLDGQVWNSPIFPRITFCDYFIRALGNTRRYTAQCVMPFNMYLERLYLFLWLWIMVLLVLTSVDLLVWFFRTALRSDRLHFIRNQLFQAGRTISRRNKTMTSDFVDHHLRQDGAFVLRLIAHNTSAVISADVTGKLWDIWSEREIGDQLPETDEKHTPEMHDGNEEYSSMV